MSDIREKLRLVIQTMVNDDISGPGSPARRRLNDRCYAIEIAIATIDNLHAILAECASALESEINARVPEAICSAYSIEQRRYDRDMDVVRRARATLEPPT